MVSAGLSAPTASGAGIAASTLSPAATYEIGQYFKGKDAESSAAHILAHTILGAAVAATGGNNALSAGIAAGGAEAAAPLLAEYLYGKKAKDLTASEKSTISSIVGLAGSAVGATTGDVSSTVQGGQSAQNAVENNKTSYKQDIKHAVLCWSAKCQQEYKDMDARQEAAYRKGQDQALSKFVEDIKNLPNVPKELYDALRNDPQGTTIAILNGIFAIPGEIINTGVTITKGNLVGSSTSDFEKLGQAEMSATLNTLSGFLSAGAVTVAKKGGKIVLGLKADFDPNLNVQVNGVSGGSGKLTNSSKKEIIVDTSKSQKGSKEYEILNNPPANSHVKLDNGTEFKTNTHGRVEEVEFQPTLTKNPRDSRQTAVGKQGDKGDVGGHIQACSLGGTCDNFNLFPQNSNFNKSAYKKWENEMRNALKDGDQVGMVKVKFDRSNPANIRPDSVEIEYSINGKVKNKFFKNEAAPK